MKVLFAFVVLAVIVGTVWWLGRLAWRWWSERRTARSRWTVETRVMRAGRGYRGEVVHKKKWLVTLRRPGEEQVFATIDAKDTDGLLEAQADAAAQAAVLNGEGIRK